MNSYSLVIDISSDEENAKTSTPLKSLPLDMIGSLSDLSIKVYRGSDAELDSTFEYPQKSGLTPKKKKKPGKVTFTLSPIGSPVSDSDEYSEEPPTPQKQPPLKPSPKINVPQERLNDLNEPYSTGPTKKSAREYHEERCSLEEKEYFTKLALELEQEEKKIAYMTAGRGRGPHHVRNYISCHPVVIKEIPHCRALPLSLASRGALSRPAPGRNFTCCSGIPGFGRGHGQRQSKYF